MPSRNIKFFKILIHGSTLRAKCTKNSLVIRSGPPESLFQPAKISNAFFIRRIEMPDDGNDGKLRQSHNHNKKTSYCCPIGEA